MEPESCAKLRGIVNVESLIELLRHQPTLPLNTPVFREIGSVAENYVTAYVTALRAGSESTTALQIRARSCRIREASSGDRTLAQGPWRERRLICAP